VATSVEEQNHVLEDLIWETDLLPRHTKNQNLTVIVKA